MFRSIYRIAQDIKQDWKNPYFGAKPYLDAMSTLDKIDDQYFCDDARTIIIYFLANATTWRGSIARSIKSELNKMIK